MSTGTAPTTWPGCSSSPPASPTPPGAVKGLAGKALQFLNDAQSYNGACRNRMDHAGHWTDQPTTDDHWGRCIWGLGTAAAHSGVSLVRRLAVIQFERAAKARSPWPRAMAFAAVGAAELLSVEPGNSAALRLLADYAGHRRETRRPSPTGRGPSHGSPMRMRFCPRR